MGRCCADCAYMDLNDTNSYGYYWCGYYRKYYPGSDSACSNYKDGNRSSGGCYITTIMCDILGYEDNCAYLNKLRAFRDDYLKNDVRYKDLLDEYDRIGVIISKKLSDDIDKVNIAKYILENFIKLVIKNIDNKEYHNAIDNYKKMVCFLKEKYRMT